MPTHEDIHRARRNGSGSGQFRSGKPINVNTLVDLLEKCARGSRHIGVKSSAKTILEDMAAHSWRITAGPHRGGRGRDGNVDKETHITVRISGTSNSYHLRLDNRGQLFQITGDGMSTVKPWIAPGA
jgi:hypothetical protein